jgi:hypothetical protein
MTVCVTALAAYAEERKQSAIVCTADKMVTYGERVTVETDSTKIISLNPSGMLCMTSGNEDGLSRFVASLLATEDFGKTAKLVGAECEKQYKACLDELILTKFLSPRQLTRDEYVQGISGTSINEYMKELAEEVTSYNMNCDVLVCGYEENGTPMILSISHPGIAVDMTRTGYHAIGSGWDHAVGSLVWQDHKRKDSLPNVMYDVLDAKISAEIGPYVGYECDMVIIVFSGGEVKRHRVPEKITGLLDTLWSEYNRTPFEKIEKDDKRPPRNWRRKLNDYAESIFPGSSVPADQRK